MQFEFIKQITHFWLFKQKKHPLRALTLKALMGRLFPCYGIIWMSTEQLKTGVLGAPIIFCEVSLQIEMLLFIFSVLLQFVGHMRTYIFK